MVAMQAMAYSNATTGSFSRFMCRDARAFGE